MMSGLPEGRPDRPSGTVERYVEYYKRISLPVAATTSFIVTIALAAADKTASATVVGTLFLGTLVFSYLPAFESFKLLGMEGKLKETIKEADDTISRLSDLVKLFARQSYSQIAYSGRISGVPKLERPVLIKELDDALRSSGLADSEIIALRDPVATVSIFDLTQTFINLIAGRLRLRETKIRSELDAISASGPIDVGQPSGQRHQELVRQLQEIADTRPRLEGADDQRVRDRNFDVSSLIPRARLSEEEQKKLEMIAQRINLLIAAVRDTIGEVTEAKDFLEKYQRSDRLHEEIFGREDTTQAQQ